MAASTAYKPSPLGYGSSPARNSPFRRAESPASPAPLRSLASTASPTKPGPASAAPRLANPSSPASTHITWTPKPGSTASMALPPPTPQSPSRSEALSRTATSRSLGNGNALSHLQPAQVRTLRDGFQILDRDCDGVVNGENVADMLNQLGLPNSPSDVAQFFPSSRQQTIALAAFLNSLAEALAALSPSAELLSAFSAFDDDDSGQVDWAELREAVLRTVPESGERVPTAAEVDKVMSGFTGRRAFNRNINAQLGAKRGEVFNYQDFVSSIMGSNVGAEGGSPGSSDD